MILLEGKKIADKILENLKKEVRKNNLSLKLVAILVGKNSASEIFIRQKEKACQKVGINFELIKFSENISFNKLKNEIEKICKNNLNSGIIIQLPLPKKFKDKEQELLNIIPPLKDVDVLSETNLGKFYTGSLKILPPTVNAVFYLFKKYKITLKGKKILIIGSGKLVGFPLSIWLLQKKATISVINEFTKSISYFTKNADIIISGVGKAELIKGYMVKNGVTIIDIGTSFKNKKIIGDADIKSVSKKVKFITPTPHGVGPLTVACLIENLIELNKK